MRQFRLIYPNKFFLTSKWIDMDKYTIREITIITKQLGKYDKDYYMEFREVDVTRETNK